MLEISQIVLLILMVLGIILCVGFGLHFDKKDDPEARYCLFSLAIMLACFIPWVFWD